MTINELQMKIRQANAMYRQGDSGISDAEYESWIDELKDKWDNDEFNSFIETLHEKAGKVNHPFIMGSLNKIKMDEPENIRQFINKFVNNNEFINISAKIDGISCRLHYENGKLISATTRGDGYKGEDLTSKTYFIKNIPTIISNNDSLDIRGELVITKLDFETISSQFKNARNATAGIIGQKEDNKELLSKTSFVAYEIMGGNISKSKQFDMLKSIGFTTAWHVDFISNWNKIIADNNALKSFINQLVEMAEQNFEYDCDGLVISNAKYKAENKYRPLGQIAFKTNQLIAQSTIIGFEWRGPARTGRFTPVAKIEPVFLGGSTIGNVTCHNIDFIQKNGIKLGSKIKIVKSGDVIPRIIEVI